MRVRYVRGLCAVISTALTVSSVQATVLFRDAFDGFSGAGFRAIGNGVVRLVNAPLRAGNFAAQFSIPSGAAGRIQGIVQNPRVFEIGQEYWIGFSNFLSTTWDLTEPGGIVFNLNERGDAIASIGQPPLPFTGGLIFNVRRRGEAADTAGRQPLSLIVSDGAWNVVVRSNAPAPVSNATTDRTVFELGAISRTQYTDWVFHVRLSPRADGFLEVWQNGSQVIDYQGPSAFNDNLPSFMQVGVENPVGGPVVGERTIYYDEIKVGDQASSYAEVAPEPSVFPVFNPDLIVDPVLLRGAPRPAPNPATQPPPVAGPGPAPAPVAPVTPPDPAPAPVAPVTPPDPAPAPVAPVTPPDPVQNPQPPSDNVPVLVPRAMPLVEPPPILEPMPLFESGT